MIRRAISIALLAWLLGFAWFAIFLPQPRDGGRGGGKQADAVIVLTGGTGRTARGIEALEKGWARRMLVSGVDREVRPHEFEQEQRVPAKLMRCCVTLGYESVDTMSNARESARWIARNKVRSVRLVTTDWHMRRAAFDLSRATTSDLIVIRDAVPSRPSLRILFLEYHKLLARYGAAMWSGE